MPQTPNEFAAALFVVIVLGALALVAAGRLVVWVAARFEARRGVSNFVTPPPAYVAPVGPAAPPPGPFHQEPEREQERERPEPAAPALPPVDGKVYTPDQIATLKAEAEERGAARALGLLLGRQLVAGEARAAAMELLFGPRGRRHQRVRPIIEAAVAEAAPPADDARLVPINGGQNGHFEM